MTTLFGVLLTAGGVAVAGWLIHQRRTVAAAFGGGRIAIGLIGFSVLANAAPVLAGDNSSALIGLLVFALVAWLFFVRRGVWPVPRTSGVGSACAWPPPCSSGASR